MEHLLDCHPCRILIRELALLEQAHIPASQLFLLPRNLWIPTPLICMLGARPATHLPLSQRIINKLQALRQKGRCQLLARRLARSPHHKPREDSTLRTHPLMMVPCHDLSRTGMPLQTEGIKHPSNRVLPRSCRRNNYISSSSKLLQRVRVREVRVVSRFCGMRGGKDLETQVQTRHLLICSSQTTSWTIAPTGFRQARSSY